MHPIAKGPKRGSRTLKRKALIPRMKSPRAIDPVGLRLKMICPMALSQPITTVRP
jgi:hypothetical protein